MIHDFCFLRKWGKTFFGKICAVSFSVLKEDARTQARLGLLTTAHGTVETPVFMDVGTLGTVKALEPRDLKELKTQVVLGNTYHLLLRPGPDVIAAAGGLHKFMGWDGPILTDSGGFQVFSLAKMRKLTEDGCRFNSHLDGHEFFLGPKESMAMQRVIGSDIAMVFDECLPYPCDRDRAEKSVEQTLRWARRSKDEPHAEGQQVFGIVQGGVYDELRRHCAEELVKIGFDGYAIGGVSVGEPEAFMYQAVDASVPYLPKDKPRYVMGLGVMHQMAECVARGVDMFDCVIAHRPPRHGHHAPRQRRDQGGEVDRRPGAGRRRLRLLLLPQLHALLRAAPPELRRDPGAPAADDPQCPRAQPLHDRDACGDCGRNVFRLERTSQKGYNTQ